MGSDPNRPQSGDYVVEYAPSGRARCRLSKSAIPKGALRIGLIVQSPTFDGTYPIWHKFSAFVRNKRALARFMNRGPESRVHGLDRLRPEDQDRVLQSLNREQADQTSKNKNKGTDSKAKSDARSSSTAPSRDTDDPMVVDEQSRQRELYRKEAERLWELKDKLKELRTGFLREMLELNDQPSSGGEAALVDRCAFGMLFGALPRCPKEGCQDNWLTFRNGKYVCTGGTEWGVCTFQAGTVDGIREWRIPEDTGVEWLDQFVFVQHEKVKYVPQMESAKSSSSPKKTMKVEIAEGGWDVQEQRPFEGLLVALAGKLSMTQAVLRALIEENGGECSSSVSTAVDILVTSVAEWEKTPHSQKLKDARKFGIPVVKEDWIHESIEQGHKLSYNDLDTEGLFISKGVADEKFVRHTKRDRTEEKSEGYKLEESSQKKVKLMIKGRSAVDPECPIADGVHVYEDSRVIYSAHLHMTDISTGTNSFYILQVLQDDRDRSEFSVWRRWGRTGTNIGSSKLEEGHSVDSAIASFRDIYYDKTGNHWGKPFVKVSRKFAPITMSYDANEKLRRLMEQQSDVNAQYRGKLDPRVCDFVRLIFDVGQMQRTLASMEIDTEKMPLGRLSPETISQGLAALSEISALIERHKKGECSEAQFRDQIIVSSNKFYTFIPHKSDDENPLKVIDSEEMVSPKLEHLDTLREMEIATSILLDNDDNSDDPAAIDLIDQHYRKLNSDLIPLDCASEEFQLLQKYLHDTHAPTHSNYTLSITAAFKIRRHGESERFESWNSVHNHELLWHGSRLTNWVGIIRQGLRIAPPEAPATGYMFGKGIYFARSSTKSANYCFASPESNKGVLLLSQVALGNTYKRLQAEYITELGKDKKTGKPYHSTWGMGEMTPNPKKSQIVDLDGVKVSVPCGELVGAKLGKKREAHLLYDEFIVYDVSQVQQRYVLQVEFSFKHGSYW